MRPVTVVVSLPVADAERSLRFYRDGLQLADPEVDGGMVAFELPNLWLFLIEQSEYAKYIEHAGVGPVASAPGACIISCAIGSTEEVDDIITRAQAAGVQSRGRPRTMTVRTWGASAIPTVTSGSWSSTPAPRPLRARARECHTNTRDCHTNRGHRMARQSPRRGRGNRDPLHQLRPASRADCLRPRPSRIEARNR